MNFKSLHKALKSGSEISVEGKFLRQLELTIEQMDRKDSRKKSVYYKPSSLNCPRQMFYYRKGTAVTDTPADSSMVGVCESGSDRHLRLQAAIKRMREFGYDCEYVDVEQFVNEHKPAGTVVIGRVGAETKCFNTIYQMSFMCDGILRIGGRYYVLEIKTENSFKFGGRLGVDEKHYNQAICYSILFGIDKVLFLYENRDILCKKSFMFTVTDKMKEELLARLAHVEECLKNDILPERCANDKPCRYCEYAKLCKLNLGGKSEAEQRKAV